VAKFAALYALVVLLFVGVMLPSMGLPTKNASALSTALALSFSWPQLVTALLGGAIAIPVILRLRRAFPNE
jgi:TRAP-type C4-dicarboxylate transport system permease small subunit